MDRSPPQRQHIDASALDRGLLSDRIYALVKARIVGGDLEPGAALVESRIAQQFGVSQSPVRDALRKLAHEGLVLQLPRRGAFVAEISEKEAHQAYRVRAALEELAASEVAAHGDEQTMQILSQEIEAMFAAARADDLRTFIEHDAAFHRIIWDKSGIDLLPRIWPMLEPSLRHLTFVANRVYFRDLEEIARGHRRLFAALRRRDENAGQIFHDHVMSVWARIQRGR